ncbi:ARL14 effector protein-like [Pecten maximus]|uniref:ARL14 effector protein-like n=1 Tax=Pecten maximus TaxID=6579 RepID=UPI001457E7BB|nr:ARL14 effector protein-like [Pecten maximus]
MEDRRIDRQRSCKNKAKPPAPNPPNGSDKKSTQEVHPFGIEDDNANSNDGTGSDDGNTVTKQLRMLTFANPGKFMDNFDPERSAREMRKMNRRIYRENIRKNQLYDETGVLLDNSLDLCDCLDMECEGCHFPCPKCGSEKCGTECRCCRKWFYEHVEVEGTNLTLKWPIPTQIPTTTS